MTIFRYSREQLILYNIKSYNLSKRLDERLFPKEDKSDDTVVEPDLWTRVHK